MDDLLERIEKLIRLTKEILKGLEKLRKKYEV